MSPVPLIAPSSDRRSAVYDAAVGDLRWVAQAPPADPSMLAWAQTFVAWEARICDERRFADWLDRWSDDGVLWAPLHADRHPQSDQTLFFDDRRRLGDRVARLADPAAWSQQPPSATMRIVGTVEAWQRPTHLLVRSACTVWEHRRGTTRAWPVVQVHRLVGADRLIEAKALLVLGAAGGVPNPAFLL